MAKVTTPVEEKINETYTIEHNGVKVGVHINYKANQISLVEITKITNHQNNAKEWIFAQRGVEYMSGWLNILEAMQIAVKDAKRRYEHELAERSKFKEGDVIAFKVVIDGRKNASDKSKGKK